MGIKSTRTRAPSSVDWIEDPRSAIFDHLLRFYNYHRSLRNNQATTQSVAEGGPKSKFWILRHSITTSTHARWSREFLFKWIIHKFFTLKFEIRAKFTHRILESKYHEIKRKVLCPFICQLKVHFIFKKTRFYQSIFWRYFIDRATFGL